MLIKNWRNKFALLLVVAAHSVHAADINPSDINTQEQLRQQERQRLSSATLIDGQNAVAKNSSCVEWRCVREALASLVC